MLRIMKCRDCRYINKNNSKCTNQESIVYNKTVNPEEYYCRCFEHDDHITKHIDRAKIDYPVYVIYLDNFGNSKAMIIAGIHLDKCKSDAAKEEKVKKIFDKLFASEGFEFCTYQSLLPYNEKELDIIFY